MRNYGIIYKITNKINGKIYIGKTKRYYGKNKLQKTGMMSRFRRHIADALRYKSNCRYLAHAIRKYGSENFVIEQVTRCKLKLTSKLETAFIKFYNSRNKKIGYNITAGGGFSGCVLSEEARKKISEKLGGDLNVHKIYRDGKHAGYRAQRKQNGVHYYKTFAESKYTLEENYKKAKDWVEEIKEGKLDDKRYVKASGLPTNILYKRNKQGIIGYRVKIIIKGKVYSKDFISNKYTMKQKYAQALKCKKSILSSKNV